MLKKDKTYTYDELKEIIAEACAKAIKELENSKKEALKDEETNPETDMMFFMHNFMVTATISAILLEDNDKEKEN